MRLFRCSSADRVRADDGQLARASRVPFSAKEAAVYHVRLHCLLQMLCVNAAPSFFFTTESWPVFRKLGRRTVVIISFEMLYDITEKDLRLLSRRR